jgi:hypothetical protein
MSKHTVLYIPSGESLTFKTYGSTKAEILEDTCLAYFNVNNKCIGKECVGCPWRRSRLGGQEKILAEYEIEGIKE